MTQMRELVDKDIKRVIVTVFHMFKKLEERLAGTEVVDDSEIKISYELSQLASTNKSVRVNQFLDNYSGI